MQPTKDNDWVPSWHPHTHTPRAGSGLQPSASLCGYQTRVLCCQCKCQPRCQPVCVYSHASVFWAGEEWQLQCTHKWRVFDWWANKQTGMYTYSRLQCMHSQTHTHTQFGTCAHFYKQPHKHGWAQTQTYSQKHTYSIVTSYARTNCLSGAFCFAIMCFLPLLSCLNGDTVQHCVCACVPV